MRTIVEESPKNIAVLDVFSKLIQDRIIFIDSEINNDLANGVIAQMLYLNSIDKDKEINIYINSPGGSILDGLAIFDVSKIISAPIRTVCIGKAASMGAILMLMGTERCATKHSRLMLHQPSGGIEGSITEMKINYEFIEQLKHDLYQIVEENSNLTKVEELFQWDTWYTAEQALACGLITKIL